MTLAVFVFVAAELDLTLAAAGIGFAQRGRPRVITALTTAGVSLVFALAVFGLWALWFVGPACVVGGAGCAVPAASLFYLALGTAAQWAWTLTIALGARFARERNLAHV